MSRVGTTVPAYVDLPAVGSSDETKVLGLSLSALSNATTETSLEL
jgi:hypothetical protein